MIANADTCHSIRTLAMQGPCIYHSSMHIIASPWLQYRSCDQRGSGANLLYIRSQRRLHDSRYCVLIFARRHALRRSGNCVTKFRSGNCCRHSLDSEPKQDSNVHCHRYVPTCSRSMVCAITSWLHRCMDIKIMLFEDINYACGINCAEGHVQRS